MKIRAWTRQLRKSAIAALSMALAPRVPSKMAEKITHNSLVGLGILHHFCTRLILMVSCLKWECSGTWDTSSLIIRGSNNYVTVLTACNNSSCRHSNNSVRVIISSKVPALTKDRVVKVANSEAPKRTHRLSRRLVNIITAGIIPNTITKEALIAANLKRIRSYLSSELLVERGLSSSFRKFLVTTIISKSLRQK